MAWLHPDDIRSSPRHEGFLYARLADGTIPTYRAGQALYEWEFNDHWNADGGWWHGGPDQQRPTPQPAALVPSCQCGWRGPDLPYYPNGGQKTTELYCCMQGDHALRAWQDHATAALTATVPDEHREQLARLAGPLGKLADARPRAALVLARQLRELADHLEPLAVAQALAHGVPWEAIGTDLGQTKQAAHGRYQRHPSTDLEQRVQALTGGSVAALLDGARNHRPGTPPSGHSEWAAAAARILGDPGGETPPAVVFEPAASHEGE
ncbi:hypothetical protein AB0D34_07865 [Streptomyces sp. NPDC048420]|uniref:hypothetical protein n=1 Tax=Streptomyces sp. NPDC048420 TaxID=3155755 RepID=UPI0034182C28